MAIRSQRYQRTRSSNTFKLGKRTRKYSYLLVSACFKYFNAFEFKLASHYITNSRVEHVPVYDQQPSSPSPHRTPYRQVGGSKDPQAASTNSNQHESDGVYDNYYHVPRLREEIDDYKKHEVYEEKGYGDSGYDHHSYKEPTQHHHYNDQEGNDSDRSEEAASSSLASNNYRKSSHPGTSLHSPDGSSTKILEYVASRLHDNAAQEKGIYAARDNIYCPEVIDFDLSSKSMAMGKGQNRGAKPRLQGLGSKIQCLKNKYFGSEPLPRAIFQEPAESKESVIAAPSFNNFFNMVRHNANSMSTFQNSNVPI